MGLRMRETNQEELQGLNEVNNVGPLLTRNACNEIVVQSHWRKRTMHEADVDSQEKGSIRLNSAVTICKMKEKSIKLDGKEKCNSYKSGVTVFALCKPCCIGD